MIISENRLNNNYIKKEKTISVIKARFLTFLIAIPFIALLSSFYFKGYGFLAIVDRILINITIIKLIEFVTVFIFLCCFHEFIHGLVWQLFCVNRWRSIKIGYKESMLPYSLCKEILFVWQYVLGLLMPFLFTGFIPLLLATFLKNDFIFILSQIMIIIAGGDVAIAFLLMKEKATTLVLDHPTLCGCICYVKK